VESPRIFISHSSLDNELTKKLCLALDTPGGTKREHIVDFDVLVDYQRLVSGTYWPKQLHEWMAKCHAAVLLLTPNAVRSPWVLKEATICAWRLSLDNQFRFFTVRFPDVTDEMLKKEKFDPLSLGEVQQIPAGDIAVVAGKIRDALSAVTIIPTPFDSLVDGLSDLFTKVGDGTLKGIAEKMRVAQPAWRSDSDPRRHYLEEIAARLLSESLGGYSGIDQLVDDLSPTNFQETVRQIFNLISPYWVDAEAAGKLPPLTLRLPRRAAGMNGSKVAQYTAAMYVQRAHPLSNRFRVIATAGGAAGGLVSHYTNEICERIRQRDNSSEPNDAIIKVLCERKPAFYVVIGELLDQQSIDDLQKLFPKVTFIIWAGEKLPAPEVLPEVEWLMPPVDVDREQKEHQDWYEAESILKNMNQR
jgi:TIR domain